MFPGIDGQKEEEEEQKLEEEKEERRVGNEILKNY